MNKKWAAIHGVWDLSTKGTAKYRQPHNQSRGLQMHSHESAPLGLLKAPVTFSGGCITTEVVMSSKELTAGVVVGYTNDSSPYYAIQIGAYGFQYSISRYEPGKGWFALRYCGSMENFIPSVPVEIKIEVVGQQVLVEYDGNLIFSEMIFEPLEGRGVGLFVWGKEEVQFSGVKVQTRKPRVFVMMPFSSEFDPLYREVIVPICKKLKIAAIRIDQTTRPGVIAEEIFEEISRADGVIAEISGGNPNVLYELGIAHTLRKPSVILYRTTKDAPIPPFDVRHHRAIFYDNAMNDQTRIRESVTSALRAISNIDVTNIEM